MAVARRVNYRKVIHTLMGTITHYPAYTTVPGLRGHFINRRIYVAASEMAWFSNSAPSVQDGFYSSIATAATERHIARGHVRG